MNAIYGTIIFLFIILLLVLLWLLYKPAKPSGEPNVSTMVSLRANFDLATRYLSAWTSLVVEHAPTLGYDVTDLYAQDATYQKFLDALNTQNPAFFLGAAHANETTFTGQNLEEIMRACVNDEVMSQRFCYLIACAAGSQLGPSMVDKTALAFLGYLEDFIFIVDENYENQPLNDPYARSFFESANVPAFALLEGKSLSEVYEITIAKWNQEIDYWGRSTDPNAPTIRTYLIHNRDSFIIITSEGLYRAPVLRLRNLPLFMIPFGLLSLLGKPLK